MQTQNTSKHKTFWRPHRPCFAVEFAPAISLHIFPNSLCPGLRSCLILSVISSYSLVLAAWRGCCCSVCASKRLRTWFWGCGAGVKKLVPGVWERPAIFDKQPKLVQKYKIRYKNTAKLISNHHNFFRN